MTKKIILLLVLILLTKSAAAAEDDINFDPLATSYSEGNPAALTLIKEKSDGAIYFVISDDSLNEMAFIKYSPKLYNLYLNENGSPAIFEMMLPNQERGQLDDNLGAWEKNIHIIPVYALFGVDGEQVICDKPFFSASYLNPSHYHDRIQNPKHVRLIEIFLKHMPRLHADATSRKISLPQ